MIKVIALDPGVTTGFATGRIEDGLMRVDSGQQEYNHFGLYLCLVNEKPNVIVCESFEFRKGSQKQGVELFSRELIGVVNLYVQAIVKNRSHLCDLKMQTASQGKGYYSDTKLKEANVYKPAHPHANDAMRHLLQWYTFGAGYKYNEKGFESLV